MRVCMVRRMLMAIFGFAKLRHFANFFCYFFANLRVMNILTLLLSLGGRQLRSIFAFVNGCCVEAGNLLAFICKTHAQTYITRLHIWLFFKHINLPTIQKHAYLCVCMITSVHIGIQGGSRRTKVNQTFLIYIMPI